MATYENIETIRKQIEAAGGPDRYIDEQEEKEIYQKGEGLGVDRATVEALLNQMCRDHRWTRELDVVPDLYDQLEEATKDDGVIDQKEFEHCVNYAVAMNMPRKRAMQLSVKFIQDNQLAIKKGWFGKDWFEPLRRQYQP
jgi:hypothetical protein